MNDCILCRIVNGDIPKDLSYEDESIIVFSELPSSKPTHYLIVPKQHIADFYDLTDNDILLKLKQVAQKMIEEQKLNDKGYRLVINGGGAETSYHLHIHLLGPLGKASKM